MAVTVSSDVATLHDCEAVTGWTTSADGTAAALNSTTYKEGSNSIELGKSGNTEAFVYYEYTFGSAQNIQSKCVLVWLYIATQAALDVIDQSDCRIRIEDSGGNWAYWNVPLYDVYGNQHRQLNLGWNALRCCAGAVGVYSRGNRGDSDYVGGSSATYPDVTDITKIRLHIATNNADDTIAQGDLLMDYWHTISYLQVDGGVNGGEADFEDFYDHDVANALGVVEKPFAGTYYFFTKLVINDYFEDYAGKSDGAYQRNLAVVFDTRAFHWVGQNLITGNANVSFGMVDNVSARGTSRGAHFYALDYRLYTFYITSSNFYSCSFSGYDNIWFLKGPEKTWNCMGNVRLTEIEGDYYNLSLNQYIPNPQAGGSFEKIRIDNGYFVYASVYTNFAVLRDCSHVDAYRIVYWIGQDASHNSILLINQEAETWDCYYHASCSDGCNLFRMYTLNLTITDKDGNAIQGASISIKDKDGNLVSRSDSGADLNEDLDNTETGVDVTDGTKFAQNDVIMIDGEFMTVQSVVGNTFTVTRGTCSGSGYIATYHSSGADIYKIGLDTTDASGESAEQLLAHSYTNYSHQNDPQPLYPFTLTISKAGYESYRTIFTPTDEMDWGISLRRSPYVGRDVMGSAWR